MLPINEAYADLMESTIRPKVEPTITVKDGLGTGRDLVWKAKDVVKISYKRGIDPLGRSLPFMEMRWTEIYQGTLNANGYSDLYENVTAFLPVQLSFAQSLGFYNTWKSLYDRGITWKELYDSKTTWKQLKENAPTIQFDFPILFLSGKPTVKERTIEWVAYDLLHFIDIQQTKMFDANADIWAIAKILFKSGCSAHMSDKAIIEAVKKTVDNLPAGGLPDYALQSNVIFDDKTNSLLKDYLSFYNMYFDFKEDYVVKKDLTKDDGSGNIVAYFPDFNKTDFKIPLTLQYKVPQIEKNNNVSSYQFKRYDVKINKESQKDVSWSDFKKYQGNNGENFYILHYIFDGYGSAELGTEESNPFKNLPENASVVTRPRGDVKEAFAIVGGNGLPEPEKDQYIITVNSVDVGSIDRVFNNDIEGDVYISDNKLSMYRETDYYHINRNEVLKRYFNKNCDSLEIDCAPNVALEPGDIIKVETHLRYFVEKPDEETGAIRFVEETIKKNVVIVENSLEYSGGLKQKIKAHEVMIDE